MRSNSGIITRIYSKSVAISLWTCSIFMGLMIVMAIRPSDIYAQESKPGEYEVKAVFLYNFVKFVEWPDDKDTRTGRIVNICILGEDPFGNAFDFIQDETIDNRKLAVKRVRTHHHIDDCQVLFISSSEKENITHILRTVKGSNILTVGDTNGFAQKGVIINFYIEQNKVRFEINLDSLRRSGLSVSSKVMHLAKIIQG